MKAQTIKAKLTLYAEILAALSGLWFGLVRPAFERIIEEELGYVNFLLLECSTEEQRAKALERFKFSKIKQP